MLALLAVVCFVLATFGVGFAHFNVIALGLAFLAAHLMWPAIPWRRQ